VLIREKAFYFFSRKWNLNGSNFSLKGYFFIYAMNCPDKQKANFNLYRKILLQLSHEVAIVNYSNYNSSIDSYEFKSRLLLQYLFRKCPSKIKDIIRRSLKSKVYQPRHLSIMNDCILKQFNNCKKLDNYLVQAHVMKKINNFRKYQTEILFTITSLIEDSFSNERTIEKYHDEEIT